MKISEELRRWVFALGLAPIACSSLAQQRAENLVLEEVIVTATKREQSLQDVAVAVSAISEEMLFEQQINTVEDLTRLVPSLNTQSGNSFNIRGIGTQAAGIAVEPSVSGMLDGVVLGRSAQSFMQLMDVQRVEVLRGPQGTLFGKNSTAGVVHIITRNPTQEHTGEVRGSVISDEEYRGGVMFSGPVTDSLGYSFTAFGSDVDGFTRNYYSGNDLNGSQAWNLRGKLRWISDTVEVKWASDYSERESDCCAAPVRSVEPFGGNEARVEEILESISPAVPGDENKDVNINREPYTELEQWGHSLEVNWDFGEYALTSITAFREHELLSPGGEIDIDGQPIDVVPILQSGLTEAKQFTQELRVASPMDDRFNYVAGLFYFDQEVDRGFTRQFEFIPGAPGVGRAFSEVNTRNWAAFGEATFNISDAWRVVFGGRYTEDELDYQFSRSREGTPIALPPPVDPPVGSGTDENNFSGKLALQWDFSDAGMTYLSFTEGYKGPAYDIVFGLGAEELQPIDPEFSESWELGVKTTLLEGRLRLNVALFRSDYEDFQAQAYIDPDGPPDCPDDEPLCDPGNDPGSFRLINAGDVRSQGLELDFMAQLTENLRLYGGAAIIDATIEEYVGGKCSDGQIFRGECPEGVQDLSGGDLPYSPDWKLTLTAAYTWQRDSLFNVTFFGTVLAQDEVLYDISQDENTIADGYTILDLSAKLTDLAGSWDTTFFVKNVTDEFYPRNINSVNAAFIPNGYDHRYVKLAERTYGVELRYRW